METALTEDYLFSLSHLLHKKYDVSGNTTVRLPKVNESVYRARPFIVNLGDDFI